MPAADNQVAATVTIHAADEGLAVPAFVDLLATVDRVYAALHEEFDAAADPPLEPLMLNQDDLEDETALRAVVDDLLAPIDVAGRPDDPPTDGAARTPPVDWTAGPRSSSVDDELHIQQFDRGGEVVVELMGSRWLLVVLWLLTPADGVYKVTEEYSLGDGTPVNKRVSFTTDASLPELTDTLRGWFD